MRQHLDWLPHLLQTGDSLFPTGAYAHSLGLEGLVEAGWVRDAGTLGDYLRRCALPGLVHLDLPLVRHAHGATVETCVALAKRCQAFRPARELREAGAQMGRQRLDLVARLTGHPLLNELSGRADFPPQLPVVYGAECGAMGVPVESAMTAYYYQAMAAQTSAALKLIRIGQTAAHTLLSELMAMCKDAVCRAAGMEIEDIGWFAPAVDIASARHETAYTRIFIS